jgi:hypothetical protein
LADNPQETVRELKELVVAYTKQETIDPLKGLGRYAAYGVGGSVLIGIGIMFLEVGMLRLLQGWGPPDAQHFTGNWSWAPYAIVVAGSFIVAGLFWMGRGKRKRRTAS